ncbi:WAT1-related protein [Pyrus ussuriensis x Pyrus communis]|uniref:WAT1-related protein n=1 Tax=Pyrus ussuriensis x Pyrus communis TaxID=2448454 RepID=A0A5N5F833_9ROSA|nr:WAT1-related protein [Pyrus ussuriensis x Pyrus communis]
MVMAIMAQTGSVVVNKAAMSTGTNAYIIVVYGNTIAALILLPSALIFHRSERPPLTFSILCRIFLLGLFCCSAQIVGNIGIEYSSPTLSTAMLNLIPIKLILGGLFLAVHAFSISLWYISAEVTPQFLLSVFFQCLFATIQSAIFALLHVGLIAALYTGIVATVLYFSVIVWCVEKVGAFYCSMFKPIGHHFWCDHGCHIFGRFSLHRKFGCAAIIVTGFYAMMWGKATEEKLIEIESLDQNKLPLLQDGIQDKRSSSIGA